MIKTEFAQPHPTSGSSTSGFCEPSNKPKFVRPVMKRGESQSGTGTSKMLTTADHVDGSTNLAVCPSKETHSKSVESPSGVDHSPVKYFKNCSLPSCRLTFVISFLQLLCRSGSLSSYSRGSELSIEAAEKVLSELAELKNLLLGNNVQRVAVPDTAVGENPFQVDSFYDFVESDEFTALIKQSFFSFAPFLLETR